MRIKDIRPYASYTVYFSSLTSVLLKIKNDYDDLRNNTHSQTKPIKPKAKTPIVVKLLANVALEKASG
jgi:hypothetical protein